MKTINDYSGYSDEELIDRLRDGEEEIMDFLLKKYERLAFAPSEKEHLFILGGDKEDIRQEGRIGLLNAIRDFDFGRDASFATFANLCVRRQVLTAISKGGAKKSVPLNSYISIYAEDFQEEGSINPEELVLDKESVSLLEATFEKELSSFEKEVLELKLMGYDYQDIALIMGKTPKSIDNALQRMKKKIGEALEIKRK